MMGDSDMRVAIEGRDGIEKKGMSVKNSNLNDELSKVCVGRLDRGSFVRADTQHTTGEVRV